MAGLPVVQVLLDDGTGSFPFDITSKARVQYGVSRGRQDEMNTVTAGQISLTLDNNDGRFTVGSTVIASPSPIVVNQRIRVKVTANGVTRTRFTGYVQQWPTEWPSGSDVASLVTVIATDAQARAERQRLRSILEEETLKDGPRAYYMLGEPVGATTASDSSGNQATALSTAGSGAAISFGVDAGPGPETPTCASFANGMYLTGAAPAVVGGQIWFKTTSASQQIAYPGLGFGGFVEPIAINASGYLSIGVGGASMSPSPVNDGNWHAVAFSVSAGTATFYNDGFTSSIGTFSTTATDIIVGSGFTGSIAHVSLWDASPPSASRFAVDHYLCGKNGYNTADFGSARITRLAGYVNLPISATFYTGLTRVASQRIAGQSVADAIRDVADAEVGLVFVDGVGELRFYNREADPSKTSPDITIAADVLYPGTRFDYDTQGLVNYFEATATRTGASAQVVRNTVSETRHGRYPSSKTYLLSSDREALDRANWIVANHAEPAPRLGSMTIDLLALDAATQSSLLSAEPNTWIRVTGLPSQTPGGTTQDFSVQGFTESLTKDTWSITFNVISRSLVAAWILGDATYGVLDTTTRLYV